MKTQLIAVVFALAIALGMNASQTSAQSQAIRVDVPFDFSANNRTLPAGTYVVYPATDNRVMWRIQGADQTHATLVLGRRSQAGEQGNTRISFRRYGDRYFLTGFKTSINQIELPMSGSEKDFRQSAGITLARLVTLETK
jgi:hypothetical protein